MNKKATTTSTRAKYLVASFDDHPYGYGYCSLLGQPQRTTRLLAELPLPSRLENGLMAFELRDAADAAGLPGTQVFTRMLKDRQLWKL
jgi:hypothetical protein